MNSELQRDILQRAMTDRDARLRLGGSAFEHNHADLDAGDLLAELLTFGRVQPTGDLLPQRDARSEWGPAESDRERANLARAIARLWRRGLVRVYRASPSDESGIGLTDAGVEAVRESRRRSVS